MCIARCLKPKLNIYKDTAHHLLKITNPNNGFWPEFEDIASDTQAEIGLVDRNCVEDKAVEGGSMFNGICDKEDQEMPQQIQNLNFVEDEQGREESGRVSSSRTETDNSFGNTNQVGTKGGAMNDQLSIEGSVDSRATTSFSCPNQLASNGNSIRNSLVSPLEIGLCDNPLISDVEIPGSLSPSKKEEATKRKVLAGSEED